jgi:hypothetical protein
MAYSGSVAGTYEFPFNLLSEGISEVASGGIVNIFGDSGASSLAGPLTLSKAMSIYAVRGVITIGGGS